MSPKPSKPKAQKSPPKASSPAGGTSGGTSGGTLAWSSSPPPPREEATPSTPSPGEQTARIQLERAGRSGKTVTLVRGLTLPAPELDALGKKLKQGCGTGGTVKDGVIEVQGDHRETLERLLRERGFKTKRAG